MKLKLEDARWQDREEIPTGIFVRAQDSLGVWHSADIVYLDDASLLVWLRSRGGDNPLAENVVGVLLGRGHILSPTPADVVHVTLRGGMGSGHALILAVLYQALTERGVPVLLDVSEEERKARIGRVVELLKQAPHSMENAHIRVQLHYNDPYENEGMENKI